MAKRKNVTGRDNLVEALSFTIEAFSNLPIEFRPDNDITDMKLLLNELVKHDTALAQYQLLTQRLLRPIPKNLPRLNREPRFVSATLIAKSHLSAAMRSYVHVANLPISLYVFPCLLVGPARICR
jgi:hypothetical protein